MFIVLTFIYFTIVNYGQTPYFSDYVDMNISITTSYKQVTF